METHESVLIRLQGNLEAESPESIAEFRNAAVHSIVDILQETETELLYACQMDAPAEPENTKEILFAARLEFRKIRAKADTIAQEKRQLLNLFVEKFTQYAHHRPMPILSNSDADVYDFLMDSGSYFAKQA